MNVRLGYSLHGLLVVLLLLGSMRRSAGAQGNLALGVIDGAVTDSSLSPLADVTALIVGSNIQVVTRANGRFRILALPAGQYTLVLRRLGFIPVSTLLQVAERDTMRVSWVLERAATALDTVVVSAQRLAMRVAEFEEHRKLGQGQFMTQAEIETHNRVSVSDLLRTFMAVNVSPVGFVTNRRASISIICPFKFFIDGVSIPTPRNPDLDLPSPKELAGIEVYANSATIPLQYKTFGGDSDYRYGGGFCGVILLWTRAGS